ncbi:hypothetical protein Emag_007050 [Eimeria magna]
MIVFPQPSKAPQVDLAEDLGAPGRSIQTLEPSSVSQSSFNSFDVTADRPPLKLARRRLLEGGPSGSSTGSAACGETIGNGSGDDPQAGLQEEELGSPPAKKAKMGRKGYEADAQAGSKAFFALQDKAHLLAVPQQQSQLLPHPQQQTAAAPQLALVSLPPLFAVATVTVPVVLPPISLVPLVPAQLGGSRRELAPVQLAAPRPVAPSGVTSREPWQEAPSERPLNLCKMPVSSNDGLEMIDSLGEWDPAPLDEAGGKAVVEECILKAASSRGR